MPKAEPKTEVVKAVANGAITVSDSRAAQLEGLASDGFDNVTAADLAMPILGILQTLSPELDKKKEQYIKGAESGQFFNSVTKQVVNSFEAVPIGYVKSYIEWRPRNSGGGYIGRHTPSAPTVLEATPVGRKLITKNGHELVETAEFFVMVLPEGGQPFMALLPLKSTQLKHARNLLTEAMGRVVDLGGTPKRLPLYLQKYQFGTSGESNQQGTWYGIDYTFLGLADEQYIPMLIAAHAAFEASTGKAAGAYAQSAPIDESVDIVANSMK